MMKAIRVHEFGGPQVLKIESNVAIPAFSDSQVYLIHAYKVIVQLFNNKLCILLEIRF